MKYHEQHWISQGSVAVLLTRSSNVRSSWSLPLNLHRVSTNWCSHVPSPKSQFRTAFCWHTFEPPIYDLKVLRIGSQLSTLYAAYEFQLSALSCISALSNQFATLFAAYQLSAISSVPYLLHISSQLSTLFAAYQLSAISSLPYLLRISCQLAALYPYQSSTPVF